MAKPVGPTCSQVARHERTCDSDDSERGLQAKTCPANGAGGGDDMPEMLRRVHNCIRAFKSSSTWHQAIYEQGKRNPILLWRVPRNMGCARNFQICEESATFVRLHHAPSKPRTLSRRRSSISAHHLFPEGYIILSKVDAVAKVSHEINVVIDNIASVESEIKVGQVSSFKNEKQTIEWLSTVMKDKEYREMMKQQRYIKGQLRKKEDLLQNQWELLQNEKLRLLNEKIRLQGLLNKDIEKLVAEKQIGI